MKKIAIVLLIVMLLSPMAYSGGIVTNTNQSAAWVRMLVRDASTGIDAVYFNPAGLTKLENGFHFSLNNQSIFQTRNIENSYPFLAGTPKTYDAKVQALIFPDIFAVYKMDKIAFSVGVVPIGGGGTADFPGGLPSFEIPVSGLVPYLQATLAPIDAALTAILGSNPGFSNVTGYNMNTSFKGTSTYLGYQATASYEINEMISVSLGARYVMAKNIYTGHLTNVTIDAPAAYGGTQKPGDYLRVVSGQLQPYDPVTAAMLTAGATQLDAQTADAYVDATQTGSGITPIIGINISPSDNLNIGIKYEHHTKIELTNDTKKDDVGLFPNEAKSRGDLPSVISVGVSFKPMSKLTAQAGIHYYMDKPAFYGKYETVDGNPVLDTDGKSFKQVNNETVIDNNFYELGLGLEYAITDNMGVSAGYLLAKTGVNKDYQSDLSYSLSSNTIGGGLYFGFGENTTLNLGFDYVMYNADTVDLTDAALMVNYAQTFKKNTMIVAVGVDFSF